MEQEFDVEIKEVLSRVQKVKAESLDDAINKAKKMIELLINGYEHYENERKSKDDENN